MGREVEPCRGCVCNGCIKAEKNGNTYGCKERRCTKCEHSDTIIKLAYCDDSIELEEKGDIFTL